jgi:hypothetical protein
MDMHGNPALSGAGQPFDLRGLLAKCVDGGHDFFTNLSGYVKSQAARKTESEGEKTSPLPHSER